MALDPQLYNPWSKGVYKLQQPCFWFLINLSEHMLCFCKNLLCARPVHAVACASNYLAFPRPLENRSVNNSILSIQLIPSVFWKLTKGRLASSIWKLFPFTVTLLLQTKV